MRVAAVFRLMTVSCTITALGCSSDGGTEPDDRSCITIEGSAQMTGDRDKLMGNGVFRFDDDDRPAEVGVYLFEMREVPDGIFVDTQYQFIWENGDSFLTVDEVFFQPGLHAGEYTFQVRMKITLGSGLFADQIGKKPLTLNATIEFGPPTNPGDLRTVKESFDMGGRVCPG